MSQSSCPLVCGHVPCRSSVFLVSSLSAVRWPLLPGSILWFSTQGLERWEVVCGWMVGDPRSWCMICFHHWAYQQSEPLQVLLSVPKTWSGLFQGGLLPLILFWREVLVSQQSDVPDSVIALLSLGFSVIQKGLAAPPLYEQLISYLEVIFLHSFY